MSPRRTQNLDMLAAVAKGLRELKQKVVFVGGATIDLYLDDPAVAGARPTDDVDCVVEGKILGSPAPLRSYLREKLGKLLANEGFIDAVPGHVKGARRVERLLALFRRLTA